MKIVRYGAILSLIVAMLAGAAVPASAQSYLFHGETGSNHPFTLKGGLYSLYVHASFARTYRTHSPDSCVFAANLQRISPTRDAVQLGGPAPIIATGPYSLGPTPVSLPAGQYVLYVASQTDCQWHFSLEPAGRQTAGIGALELYVPLADNGLRASTSYTLADRTQFEVPYGVGPEGAAPTGELQLFHDGQLFQHMPLERILDPVTKAPALAVTLQWEQSDARYAGKNVAKVVVKIGSKQYTSSKEFTLSP